LEGDGSLSIVKFNAASGGQGHGCSYDFNVGTDQARMMEISFDYLWTDVAANADGDFIVYIYDVDKGVLIQPVGYEIFRSGFKSQHKATFQTDATSDDYRVIFHVAQDRADVYSLKVDNLYVGPQRGGVSGAVITDWEDFTPVWSNATGIGFTTSYSKIRRDGPDMLIDLSVTATGNGTIANILTLDIPDGKSLKLPSNNALRSAGQYYSNAFGEISLFYGFYDGKIYFSQTYERARTLNGNEIGSADKISIMIRVPILGWASNTVMSEDAGNREIEQTRIGNDGQSVPSGVNTPINFVTDLTLTGGDNWRTGVGYNSTLGTWTTAPAYIIPESGLYDIDSYVFLSGVYSTGTVRYIVVILNGVLLRSQDRVGAIPIFNFRYTKTHKFNKGDVVSIGIYQNSGSPLILEGTGNSHFSICKRSSPQTIAQSEKVIVLGKITSGQATTSGTTLIFNAISKNTHGAYNTTNGFFTAPKSGLLKIKMYYTTRTTAAVGDYATVQLYKNGSVVDYGPNTVAHSTTYLARYTVQLNYDIDVNKGDVIHFILVTFGALATDTIETNYNNLSLVME
jgi:hypothetical protein